MPRGQDGEMITRPLTWRNKDAVTMIAFSFDKFHTSSCILPQLEEFIRKLSCNIKQLAQRLLTYRGHLPATLPHRRSKLQNSFAALRDFLAARLQIVYSALRFGEGWEERKKIARSS